MSEWFKCFCTHVRLAPSTHKSGLVPCLSALWCFPSLCLSLLSCLMISAAVIINSLIWCQHSLVYSPDACTRTFRWIHVHAHTHTLRLNFADGFTYTSITYGFVCSHTNSCAHSRLCGSPSPSLVTRELISFLALLFSQVHFTKLFQAPYEVKLCSKNS